MISTTNFTETPVLEIFIQYRRNQPSPLLLDNGPAAPYMVALAFLKTTSETSIRPLATWLQ